MLRERTLGNSPACLVKQLRENHGEEWLARLADYLGECAAFVDLPSLFPVTCQEPPQPLDVCYGLSLLLERDLSDTSQVWCVAG